MDDPEFFATIVTGLSRIRTRMKNIAHTLRGTFPNASIQHAIEFAEYPDRNVIELYIDLALGAGKSLCWWIDIERMGQVWNIEASLRRDEGNGADTAWKATYKADTVEEIFSHLSVVLDEMQRFANQKGKSFI